MTTVRTTTNSGVDPLLLAKKKEDELKKEAEKAAQEAQAKKKASAQTSVPIGIGNTQDTFAAQNKDTASPVGGNSGAIWKNDMLSNDSVGDSFTSNTNSAVSSYSISPQTQPFNMDSTSNYASSEQVGEHSTTITGNGEASNPLTIHQQSGIDAPDIESQHFENTGAEFNSETRGTLTLSFTKTEPDLNMSFSDTQETGGNSSNIEETSQKDDTVTTQSVESSLTLSGFSEKKRQEHTKGICDIPTEQESIVASSESLDDFKKQWESFDSIHRKPESELISLTEANPQKGYEEEQRMANEDAALLASLFKKKPELMSEVMDNFNKMPPRLQKGFIAMMDNPDYRDLVSTSILFKMKEIMVSNDFDTSVKGFAVLTAIKSSAYSDKQKGQFIKLLNSEDVLEHIRQVALNTNNTEASAYINRIQEIMNAACVDSKVNVREIQETGARQGVAMSNASTQEETEHRIQLCCDSGYFSNKAGAEAAGRDICKHSKPESTVAAAKVLTTHEKVHNAAIDSITKNIPNCHKDAQLGVFKAVNDSDKTTIEQRKELACQIHSMHNHVQLDAVKSFLAEEKNTQNELIMNEFIAQVSKLEIETSNKIEVLAQVEKIQNVSSEIVEKASAEIQKIVKQASSKSIIPSVNEFAKIISEKVAKVVAQVVAPAEKPTLQEFRDMLDREVITAEFVANEGFKDVLIAQFSALNGDTQKEVLKTLTVEEKLMMRKKGMLPRRFWEGVDELAENKAVEGGNISSSDARYLAQNASNTILYRCLTDSRVKLSENDRALFRQTLIDNRYLKKVNGQYQKA